LSFVSTLISMGDESLAVTLVRPTAQQQSADGTQPAGSYSPTKESRSAVNSSAVSSGAIGST